MQKGVLVPPTHRAATELWWAWAEIAGEQSLTAAAWRRAAAAENGVGGNPSNSIAQETKATMAALVAAGAALETLGRSIKGFGDAPSAGRGAAERLINTVQHVFPEAAVSADLSGRVGEVFRLRNLTVHYAAEFEEMGPHPIGRTTTWVARTFVVEAADASVDTVADVITAATNPGLSLIPQATWWAARNKSVGAALKARATAKLPLDLVP